MSWLYQLYSTYESNLDQVGVVMKKRNDKEYTLLPISHTTQNAHIEVDITEDGQFHSARVIDKESTLIPCTESSSSRAGSKIAPYPLHDKLSYVAGDFVAYGGKIKNEEPFSYYIEQLEEWVNSPYGHSKVKSIYLYLKKKQLIKDLTEHKVLFLDKKGNLIQKWNKEHEKIYNEKPEIFTKVSGGQDSAFVRFNVYSSEKLLEKVWNDKEVYDSFINFYNDLLQEKDFCFVTGQLSPSTERHANKIRHAADKAKLISANDTSGFTFRGRFNKSNEAVNISYDVSQKAHNALKWLIHRQGKMIDNRVFLVWGNDQIKIIDPIEDTFSIHPNLEIKQEVKSNTLKEFSNEVAKAIDGYKNDMKLNSEVNILVLDSATTGRMAVLYYRNMHKELYLDKLKNWHTTCVWLHQYRKNDQNGYGLFYGAPATKDIAFAAYGPRANEKVIKGLMERILPCILDGKSIPEDIVRSAVNRASNPVSMENWEWNKTLSIACALLNKREGIGMALDENNGERDYLFGRLLAVAYVLEKWALNEQGEKRDTNAERYMVSFSNKPRRTWKTIHDSLIPYKSRLGGRATKLYDLIIAITNQFKVDDFNDEALSGNYLLGFSSQVIALDTRKKTKEKLIESGGN